MDPPLDLIKQALPPLLALPVELKIEIISHLSHDEYPSLACLRRTHSSFLNVIPKAHIRSKLSETDLCNQLLKTELEYAYLFPPDHYPCYFCARALPLDAFTINHVRQLDHGDGKKYLSSRSCKDCCMQKKGSFRRSFIESLIWIGYTLDELPMPPLRPRLRPASGTTLRIMVDDLEQHMARLKQQAKDHGTVVTEDHGRNALDEVRFQSMANSTGNSFLHSG